MNDVYVLIAVRMKSSRLKKKALIDIYSEPLLKRLINRMEENFPLERIIVCTSTNEQDDAIESFCVANGYRLFRGHELDVMKRFLDASSVFKASTIIRVTGDNPLTDSETMIDMINFHIENSSEYTYTSDLPIGTRPEIIDVGALRRIHGQLRNTESSEYMTFMLMRPEYLKVSEYKCKNPKIVRPNISLTVDTIEDLELIRFIYKSFNGVLPSLENILLFLEKNPDQIIYVNNSSVLPSDIDCSYYDD